MTDSRRVLFLTSNYPRWAGDTTTPFVHDLAADLAARGCQVEVLAPHAPGAARSEVLDGVPVHRFRYVRPESAQTVCYGGGALVNIAAPSTLAKVPLLVAAEWAATTWSLRGRFDVLHAHWILPQGFVATACPRFGAARVITAHGGDVFGLRGALLDRFARRALECADAVTVNSSATARAVAELAPAADVSLIPTGADTAGQPDPETVDRLRAACTPDGAPLLVFLGRVVADKGVDDLLECAALLVGAGIGVRVAVVGTGQHLDAARRLAAELGIADRVAFPGWAAPSDVASWFTVADVVLAPSRIGAGGWQEGQGLAIIEAMSAGRPVVSTRTGGIPETIEDGISGILVEQRRPDELAAAVRGLLADPERAAAMGARARISVVHRFSRAAAADRFAELYAKVAP